MSLRIVIADDQRMYAEVLAALLEKEQDLEVVGCAKNGREAVATALKLRADVVVMDATMPVLNGIEAARRLASERRSTKVVCLVARRDKQCLTAALAAGATGCVVREAGSGELVAAIRSIVIGGLYLCPEMTAVAAEEYRASLLTHTTPTGNGLTEREREILQLVAEGYSSYEIASDLCISERTVGTHRLHLAKKLGVHNVAELTKYAIRHGLTTVERDRRDSPLSQS